MSSQKNILFLCLVCLLIGFLSGCANSPKPTNANLTPLQKVRSIADVNTIAFEWDPIQDSNVAGYLIYRQQPTQTDFVELTQIESRYSTHYVDKGLKSATTYSYLFATYDNNGNKSTLSPVYSVTTLDIEPISFVQAMSNYPRKVKLIWSPHENPRVVGYGIQREDGGKWKEIGRVKNRLLVEYLDTNLKDDTSYRYRIYAYNQADTRSAYSKVVEAKTKPKPVPVTNFKASSNLPKKILLTWNTHPNPEVTNYTIYRSSYKDWGYFKHITLPRAQNSYTDTIDSDGASYYYQITATDKDGIESLANGNILGQTLAIPNPPTITYARIENSSQVVLRWRPQDNRAVEYAVYKRNGRFFGDLTKFKKVPTAEFIDNEVVPGERYYYEITSIDKNGLESKHSETVDLYLPEVK